MPTWTALQIAQVIDHTLLKADATASMFDKLCQEAITHRFASVCVPSSQVQFCSELLQNSLIPVCTVIGFPFGYASTASKIREAEVALTDGARELDVVLNIGWLKSGYTVKVEAELQAICALPGSKIVKIILETSALTTEEKILGCRIAESAGAQFVKTSTGFGSGGATLEDIRLMKQTVSPTVFVKASGGIRTRDDAIAYLEAGVQRIGTSAGVAMVTGAPVASSSY